MDISTISPETQKILGACAIALGLIYCFFGYRFLKVALFATGFVICSLSATFISYLLAPKSDLPAIIACIAGGLAGGFLFFFVYLIGVFTFGAAFGSMIGFALTAAAGRDIQPLLIVLLGVIGGSLALLIKKHVIILATSFGGGGIMVSGGWYLAKGIDPITVIQEPLSLGRDFQAIIACWIIASLLGVLIQYGITSKSREKLDEEDDEEAEKPEASPQEQKAEPAQAEVASQEQKVQQAPQQQQSNG